VLEECERRHARDSHSPPWPAELSTFNSVRNEAERNCRPQKRVRQLSSGYTRLLIFCQRTSWLDRTSQLECRTGATRVQARGRFWWDRGCAPLPVRRDARNRPGEMTLSPLRAAADRWAASAIAAMEAAGGAIVAHAVNIKGAPKAQPKLHREASHAEETDYQNGRVRARLAAAPSRVTENLGMPVHIFDFRRETSPPYYETAVSRIPDSSHRVHESFQLEVHSVVRLAAILGFSAPNRYSARQPAAVTCQGSSASAMAWPPRRSSAPHRIMGQMPLESELSSRSPAWLASESAFLVLPVSQFRRRRSFPVLSAMTRSATSLRQPVSSTWDASPNWPFRRQRRQDQDSSPACTRPGPAQIV